MTKRKLGGNVRIFAGFCAAIVLCACVLVAPGTAPKAMAAGTAYAADSSSSDEGTNPGNTGGATASTEGEFKVTGYEIKTINDNGDYDITPLSITKDMPLRIIVSIHDERLDSLKKDNASATWKPRARLNTHSFPGTLFPPAADTGAAVDYSHYQIGFYGHYTGTGNLFQFDVYYEDLDLPVQTVTLTLNQTIEYKAPDSSSDSSSESSSAVVIGTGFSLKSVEFGGNEIKAGSDFTLNAEILATSGTYPVNNVSVEVVPPKDITVASGSNVVYIGTMKPNSSVPIPVSLHANANAEEGSAAVVLKVSGVASNDGSAASAEISVAVPIIQPERFELGNIQMPQTLTVGTDDGSGYGSFNLINKGKSTIYNVSVNVTGEGLSTVEGEQFVGNINPGSQTGADMTLLAASAGTVNATLTVTYENSRGEEKTLSHDFTIQATGGSGGDGSDVSLDSSMQAMIDALNSDTDGAGGSMPWWGWALLVVLGGGGIITGVVVHKANKAKKDAAALEDDTDETV